MENTFHAEVLSSALPYFDRPLEDSPTDYDNVADDLDFLLPHIMERRKANAALLCLQPFAHLDVLPQDVITPTRLRTNVRLYTGYTASATLLFFKIERSYKPARHGLELLLTLPPELLQATLEQLHPIDLHHLSRASKSFHRFLWSKSLAGLLWKSVFKLNPSVPECPPDFAEPRWASLLYHDSCDVCGAKGSLAEWHLRRRLCAPCQEAGTSREHNEVSYLLPVTPSLRYWKADADCARAHIKTLQNHVDEGKPGAQQLLAMYIDARVALRTMINDHAENCEVWRDGLQNQFLEHISDRAETVVSRIRMLLRRYGVHPEDADDVNIDIDQYHRLGQRYMSRQQFEFFLPTLEAPLRYAKQARLEREHQKSIYSRSQAIQDEYIEFTRRHPAWTWGYQPNYDHIVRTFEDHFHHLIHAEGSDPIPPDQLKEAFKPMEAMLYDWRLEKMTKLAALLPGNSSPPDLEKLELATAVFTCWCTYDEDYYMCQIGWDEAGEHVCCCNPRLSVEGVRAAESLIRLVGLDPKTTTATTMDRRDARFACACCHLEEVRGARHRKSRNWRDSILHWMTHTNDIEGIVDDDHNGTPSWILFTPAATLDIRRREGQDAAQRSDQWGCCHCGRNWLEYDEDRPAVRKHLRDVHHLEKPIDGLDLILYEKFRRPRNPPTLFPDEPLYRCTLCFNVDRLFTRKQFEVHQGKHVFPDNLTLEERLTQLQVTVFEAATVEPPSASREVRQDMEL